MADGAEGDAVAALDQVVHVGQHLAEPLRGCDDLVHTQLAVVVAIQKRQCALVKLKTFHRAAKHRPQLLVKLGQMRNVLPVLNVNTGHTANGAELPVITLFGD